MGGLRSTTPRATFLDRKLHTFIARRGGVLSVSWQAFLRG